MKTKNQGSLLKKQTYEVVGLMSGTSLDACDLVWCRYQYSPVTKAIDSFQFLDQVQYLLPKALKKQSLQVAEGRQALTAGQWAHFQRQWGRYYKKVLSQVTQERKWSFQLVGLHGQTVYHEAGVCTLQVGDPAAIALAFKAPVVHQFRHLDVESGFAGAPLAPLFHGQLAQLSPYTRIAFQNLGGIGNVTYLTKKKGATSFQLQTAFDTGPGNMPLDNWMRWKTGGQQQFDKNGRWAAQGSLHPQLLRYCQQNSYFKKKPPKACGREQFGADFLNSILQRYGEGPEVLHTLTEWVAWSVAHAYGTHLPSWPQVVYLCGGGALNAFLVERIQSYMPEVKVLTTEALGWPLFAIEGAAFAYLAAARWHGIRHNLKPITGQPRPLLLGDVVQA